MRLLVELFLYGAIADPTPIVTVVKELASVDGNLLLAGASGGGGFRSERERERAEREREGALASLTLLVAFARCGRPLLGLQVDAAEEEVSTQEERDERHITNGRHSWTGVCNRF